MSEEGPERYQIIARHGHDWTGVSYHALDTKHDRHVVLKPLPGVCAQAESKDALPTGFVGFSHPKVVSIYDVLEESGQLYAAMEHAAGKTLAELARGHGQPISLVRMIAVDCLEALVAGAARRLVHGDITPDNILLVEQEDGTVRAKLQDFGFIGMIDEEGLGIIAGDVHYLAPERFAGHPADERADLYALGASLYFALTGRTAYPQTDAVAAEAAHQKLPAKSLAGLCPDVPGAFILWVERLLSSDRHKRPANARVALLTLPLGAPRVAASADVVAKPDRPASTQQGSRVRKARSPRRWLVGAGVLLGMVMGFGSVLLWQKYQAQRDSDLTYRRSQVGGGEMPGGEESPILLAGESATIHGNQLHFSPNADRSLVGWMDKSEYPEWQMTIRRAGNYRVSLEYAYGGAQEHGGSLMEVILGGRSLTVDVKRTGSWSDFETAELGVMEVPRAGVITLEFKPVAKSQATLMHVRSLTLTRLRE